VAQDGAPRERNILQWCVCLGCLLWLSTVPVFASSPASAVHAYEAIERSVKVHDHTHVIPAARTFLKHFPHSPQRPQVLFWLAEGLYAMQAYQEAAATYRLLVHEAPTFAEGITACRHLALSYIQLRHYNMALQTLSSLLEQFPGMADRQHIVLQMAAVYVKQGRFDEALPLYEQLLLVPKPPVPISTLHLWLGDCYLYLQRLPQARHHYLTVVRNFANSSEALQARYQLGTIAMLNQQYEDAREYFRSILQTSLRGAGAIRAHYAMAWAFYYQGQAEQAVDYLNRWQLLSQPTAIDTLLAQAYDQFQLRAYADVVERLTQALEQIEDEDEAQPVLWLLARASVESGQVTRALDVLDDFIRRFPASLLVAAAQRWRGDLLLRSGDVSQALIAYQAALSQTHDDEQSEQLLLRLAEIYQSHYAFEEAMTVWRRLLQDYPLSPRHTQVTLRLGAALVQQGAIAEAVARYRGLLATELPAAVRQQTQMQLAWAYLKGNEYDRARAIYRELIDAAPDTNTQQQARYWLGWILQRQGEFEASNTQWQALLALEELPPARRADVLWRLASNLMALERYQEACDRLQDAVATDDTMAPYVRLANRRLLACWLQQHRYQQAFQQSSVLVSHDPLAVFQVPSNLERAERLLKAKRYRQARYVLQQIVALPVVTSLTDDAVFMIADSYLAEGDTRRAMQHYRDLRQQYTRTPFLALAAYREGMILSQAGQLQAAAQALQEAAQNASEAEIRERAWYHLGKIYVQLEQREAAVAVLRRLLQEGTMAFATEAEHLNVGLMLQRMGDYETALQVLQRIAKQTSSMQLRAEVQFWIAETYQLQGDVQTALHAYQQVASQYPDARKWALTALFRAAEIYEQRQQYAEAITLYQRVAAADPDHPRGRYAANRARRLKSKPTEARARDRERPAGDEHVPNNE
jgi:TolA-binding protein